MSCGLSRRLARSLARRAVRPLNVAFWPEADVREPARTHEYSMRRSTVAELAQHRWESASPRQQVGKAINLNKMTECDYLCEVRQRFCHGVVARPNSNRPSRPLTNGF
jgi:hypothetical protein